MHQHPGKKLFNSGETIDHSRSKSGSQHSNIQEVKGRQEDRNTRELAHKCDEDNMALMGKGAWLKQTQGWVGSETRVKIGLAA